MSKSNELPAKRLLIEEILKYSFPDLMSWEMPKYYDGIGPYSPKEHLSYSDQLGSWKVNAHYVLNNASHEALIGHLMDLRLNIPLSYKDPFLVKEVERLGEFKRFIWWASGFNVVSREADFNHWAHIENLELFEAVALSIGFEPCELVEKDIQQVSERNQALQFFKKRQRLIHDRFYRQKDPQEHPSATQLCEWAKEIGLDLPQALIEAVNKNCAVKNENEKRTDLSAGPEFQSIEKMSLLKLIAGMAAEQYGFNPNDQRSKATSHIIEDVQAVGLSLDHKTTLKWLRESSELVSNEYWDSDQS